MAKAALLCALGIGTLALLYWRTATPAVDAVLPAQSPAAGSTAQSKEPEAQGAVVPEATLPKGYTWVAREGRAHLTGPTMGTMFTVTLAAPSSVQLEAKATVPGLVHNLLEGVNQEMSTYLKDSKLSRFNRGPADKSVPVSRDFASVVQISKQVYAASEGAFDPTVGPLVRAWGFGPTQRPETEPDVAALLPSLGFDEIGLLGGELPGDEPFSLAKARLELELDLSAVAKGHAADLGCRALETQGYVNVMVEVGGEVCVRGESAPGVAWRIGVERPGPAPKSAQPAGAGQQGVQRIVELGAADSRAIATSGDYRNYYELDGKRLSHTIDPRTGRPVEHKLASVSVLSASAGLADAWATALTVLGPDAGLELAQAQGLAAYFLVRDDTAPGGFSERMTEPFAAHSVTVPQVSP